MNEPQPMSTTTCPKCGSVVHAVAGQCPRCLLEMALAPDDHLPGADSVDWTRRQIDDYVLGPQIGAGGMGVVYEATRLSDHCRVALKLIRDFNLASPSTLCRFTVEAEAAARLDHPHIVRIPEIGECDGQPFISMDLIEGESLSTKISQGAFRVEQIPPLMAKLARAVHHAHSRGVLH